MKIKNKAFKLTDLNRIVLNKLDQDSEKKQYDEIEVIYDSFELAAPKLFAFEENSKVAWCLGQCQKCSCQSGPKCGADNV